MDKKTREYIKNVLRKGTIAWEGRRKCLVKGRKRMATGKVYKNGKKQFVWHYQCEHCDNWFREESIEIDHIEEVGNYSNDLMAWIEKLYDETNLQRLCIVCHKKKTSKYNSRRRFSRKQQT